MAVRIKSYAKLNLTLHVTGVKDGYHMLDSVVTGVDLYDLIVLKKRKDKLVSIMMHGQGSESIAYEDNNAVKAAEQFIEKFKTNGADITIYKNIPMGMGMGGSSADSAGVLNGLAKLYCVTDKEGIDLIADNNGSDTKYMLDGGYARLTGRGDKITPIESGLKLNFLLLAPKDRVSTAECFKTYDSFGVRSSGSDSASEALSDGDIFKLAKSMCNSLTPAAIKLSDSVKMAFKELSAFDPLAVNMTGSGSGVYALFETRELRDYARSRYNGKFTAYSLKSV